MSDSDLAVTTRDEAISALVSDMKQAGSFAYISSGGMIPVPAPIDLPLDLILDQPSAVDTPPAVASQLDFDTRYITFDGGVPVGGYSHVTLFPDGTVRFTGHFHVSGAPSYNVSLVWGIKTCNNSVGFALRASGRCHGTFESGSRDFNWDETTNNALIAQHWQELSGCSACNWHAAANADLESLFRSSFQALGFAVQLATILF